MDTVYQRNMPEYTSVMHNFQDFLVTMDRADWKKRLSVKSETDYYNSDNQRRKIQSVNFKDPQNMKIFFESKSAEIKSDNETKLQTLKQEINQIIN